MVILMLKITRPSLSAQTVSLYHIETVPRMCCDISIPNAFHTWTSYRDYWLRKYIPLAAAYLVTMDIDEAVERVGGWRRFSITTFLTIGTNFYFVLSTQGINIVFVGK